MCVHDCICLDRDQGHGLTLQPTGWVSHLGTGEGSSGVPFLVLGAGYVFYNKQPLT